MTDQSATVSKKSGCEITEGTRNEIRALRNAGQLEPGCTYTVTGYSRGCLNNDVRITLTATDVDEFSLDVEVHTGWDNSAWQGIYDLDLNRVHALRDNLGNEVRGRTGTEVDTFPWGLTQFQRCDIKDARLIVPCDQTSCRVNQLILHGDSQLNITGTTGTITDVQIDTGSLVFFQDATGLNFQRSKIDSRARIYGERSATVTLLYLKMSSEGYWLFRDKTDIRAYYVTIDSTARIYYTDGDRQWFYYCNIGSYAHIRQFAGTIQAYYSNFDSYAEFRNEVGSGVALIYGVSYSSRGYVRNYNAARIRPYFDNVNSRGEVRYEGTVNQNTYYLQITSFGRLIIQASANIAYAIRVDTQSIYTLTGGNHYRDFLSGYARLTTAFNTRSVYGMGSWVKTLTAANTNKGKDYFNDSLV